MGRKRIELDPAVEAEIMQRRARGEGGDKIARALAGRASGSTVRRRLAEMRAAAPAPPVSTVTAARLEVEAEIRDEKRTKVARAAAMADPPGDELEEPLEGVDAATAARWLARVERAAQRAQAEGNLGALGTMGRLVATFLEHKRKAAPIRPPDPNEHPDMIAARERARTRFHELIDKALTAA